MSIFLCDARASRISADILGSCTRRSIVDTLEDDSSSCLYKNAIGALGTSACMVCSLRMSKTGVHSLSQSLSIHPPMQSPSRSKLFRTSNGSGASSPMASIENDVNIGHISLTLILRLTFLVVWRCTVSLCRYARRRSSSMVITSPCDAIRHGGTLATLR